MAKYIDADKLIANLERQNVDKKVIEPVIRIIDSLQQEQQEVDLEKEINKWLDGPTTDLRTMARHFAEWQREQMLKDAVECNLYYDGDFLAIDLNMAELGYSERDKVKVIVLKEEEE